MSGIERTRAMQQAEQSRGPGGADRRRLEMVVETLAAPRSGNETLAEVAHEARNMVAALVLYCDLLEEPGVLAAPFLHYGCELRLVAAASHRLAEKLLAMDPQAAAGGDFSETGLDQNRPRQIRIEPNRLERTEPPANWPAQPEPPRIESIRHGSKQPARLSEWEALPSVPIDNLAEELSATRSLLAALAGPSIALTVQAEGGARAVWLTAEDLTRVLVNLVKNSAEAMPAGGSIELGLREIAAGAGIPPSLSLTIKDSGPGIPQKALKRVFESGFTTRQCVSFGRDGWQAAHRGLGLSITRSVIEGAYGQVSALDHAQTGACIEIELPIRAL